VLHSADTAMYRAKQRSLGVQWAEAATGKADHRGLEVELWGAAARGELSLHYQPVFELATRRIVGLEALLRWRHPTLGNVSPADFIPIAEDTGQIVGLDCWVLERGVAQLGAWAAGGYRGQVALNVSARSLGDERWMRALERTVEAQPALCRRLVLEVTESATMRDPEAVLGRIAALRELGIDIAIDDFGMGYSSLSYLRRIRATHLKLDRSFVHGIGLHRRDEELIELILELAARWQLVVVAEGVETAEQERWLRERGCPHAQGFGLARPTTAEAVGAMIAAPAALAVAV
jgi:EAL domain-containing protein (putative c-di-GMP-specific phosphodiesterase class I)